MRVALLGRDLDEIRSFFPRFGIEEVSSGPTSVITHGGDGTLIGAERQYPGIPKIPIRSSKICRKCLSHTTEQILDRLVQGELKQDRLLKVEVRFDASRKTAMNEVGIHMANPASAIRFRLFVNDQPYVPDEIIGDGLVVATPFGSTAYFRSVTRGTFRLGLGLTIVNSVEPIEWAVLRETETVRVEITRGPALVLADNDPDHWRLDTGNVLDFSAAETPAVILGFDALTCPHCVLTHPRPPR